MSFLQIASWNIEHFGGKRGDNAPKQSVYALADHIEMAGVDLIALQEVYTTSGVERATLGHVEIETRARSARRNADLDIVCYLLEEHLGDPWHYIILPNRNDGDVSQLCAVMWNTKRLTFSEAIPLEVVHRDGDDWLWDRKPHACCFSSEVKVWHRGPTGDWVRETQTRGLTVVPLHMKANGPDATGSRRKRHKEAASLCDALKAVEVDPSIILIGDTNILDNYEPAVEAFVNAGFVDLNNGDSSTYWSIRYKGAPFDRAFVARGRPEFRYTRQYVLQSADLDSHYRFLSDHYMIKLSVKDYVDDRDVREDPTR